MNLVIWFFCLFVWRQNKLWSHVILAKYTICLSFQFPHLKYEIECFRTRIVYVKCVELCQACACVSTCWHRLSFRCHMWSYIGLFIGLYSVPSFELQSDNPYPLCWGWFSQFSLWCYTLHCRNVVFITSHFLWVGLFVRPNAKYWNGAMFNFSKNSLLFPPEIVV